MTLKQFLLIALGSILGSTFRYLIICIPFNIFVGSELFLTAFINILGSLIIGILSSLSLSTEWTLFAIVGLLGSFTTFSSFTAGFFKLLDQSIPLALSYFLLSILGSFIVFMIARTFTLKILT